MALLPILEYPDPRLREVAKPVVNFDDALKKLAEDMAETMYAAPGVGLAAPQVGVSLRLFVIDTASEDEPSQLRSYVNPTILELRGSMTWNEGCLSFPGASEEVKRAAWVKIRAFDLDGNPFELEGEDLLGIALQHENDHLDGKLMIDRVGPLARRRMGKKLAIRAKQR